MDTITTWLSTHHLAGLVTGAFTFLIIGLFHPLVIKAEYSLGTKSWIIFLLSGLVFTAGSIAVKDTLLSVLCGVTAFSSFWSILEVFQQRERVRKGWFPANPKKKQSKHIPGD